MEYFLFTNEYSLLYNERGILTKCLLICESLSLG